MTIPHFSVVIPVYNGGATIGSALASVIGQTDNDFEIIVVDDGSVDDSLAVMLNIAASDTRIRVVSQANAGVASARNLGVNLARGELIAFLDADDRWRPEKLARHRLHHAARPDTGVSFARIAFRETGDRHDETARTHSTVPAHPLTLTDLLGENPACTAPHMVPTRACFDQAGGCCQGMNHAEDQEWLARVAVSEWGVTGIDALLVDYHMSPSGLSSDVDQMHAGWTRLARTHLGPDEFATAEAIYCRYLARRALRSGAGAGTALHFAVRGLACSRSAFFNDRRRGGLTLAAALVSPLIPGTVRARLFA